MYLISRTLQLGLAVGCWLGLRWSGLARLTSLVAAVAVVTSVHRLLRFALHAALSRSDFPMTYKTWSISQNTIMKTPDK